MSEIVLTICMLIGIRGPDVSKLGKTISAQRWIDPEMRVGQHTLINGVVYVLKKDGKLHLLGRPEPVKLPPVKKD